MKEIKKELSKLWWGSIINSLLFVVIGIMLIIKPKEMIAIISMIIGIAIIIAGIFAFVRHFKAKKTQFGFRLDFIYGTICIVAGSLLVLNPEAIASVLPLILGIWMVINSMTKIEYILTLKREKGSGWMVTFVLTIITLSCGLLFIFNPFKGASILTRMLGIIITSYALMDVINSSLLKKNVKKYSKQMGKVEENIKEAVLVDE